MYWNLLAFVLFSGVATYWMVRGVWGRGQWRRRLEKATAALPRQVDELERQFLEAAAATGKPRGLVWSKSQFHDQALLARDRANGDIYALVGITIAFEAVVGGDMEHVEAVGNLRCATALLEWRSGKWTTAGRVLFNLEPDDAVERYAQNLDAICQVPIGRT